MIEQIKEIQTIVDCNNVANAKHTNDEQKEKMDGEKTFKIDTNTRSHETTEHNIESMKREIKVLEDQLIELGSVDRENQALRKELEELKNTTINVKQSNSSNTTVASCERRLTKLKEKNRSLVKHIASLTNQHQRTSVNLQQSLQMLDGVVDERDQLRNQLDKMTDGIEGPIENLRRRASEADDLEAERDELIIKVDRGEEILESIMDIQCDRDEILQQMNQLEDLNAVRRERDQLKVILEKIKKKGFSGSGKCDDLEEELELYQVRDDEFI